MGVGGAPGPRRGGRGPRSTTTTLCRAARGPRAGPAPPGGGAPEAVAGTVELAAGARVLHTGPGTRDVLHHLLLRSGSVMDTVVVDPAERTIAQMEAFVPPPERLGNSACVRCRLGPVADLPYFYGPFDAVYVNSAFAWSPDLEPEKALLTSVCTLLKPGGHVVVSSVPGPGGGLALEATVGLEGLVSDLPLRTMSIESTPERFIAKLHLPANYRFEGAPLFLQAPVVNGFGRGSREMGTPTANLDVPTIRDAIAGLPRGVYFGWAQRAGAAGEDGAVHKMVMNVGERPSFADGEDLSVEVHVLHRYGGDFYGEELKVAVLGFLRPEIQFSGLDALVQRIQIDIGTARKELDEGNLQRLQSDPFFTTP